MTTTPVLVAGAGGLGSHVLESLVRLAPLRLELWDPAVLDEPDLNRQILYEESDLGSTKADAAAARLRRINHELTVHPVPFAIDPESFPKHSALAGLFSSAPEPADRAPFVIFDCLDSFPARSGLGSIAAEYGAPLFHGGVEGWFGQAATILPESGGYAHRFGPDFATIPRAPKPILPQTVATIAAVQVAEFTHWCIDPASPTLASSLLLYDGMLMRFDRIELAGAADARDGGAP